MKQTYNQSINLALKTLMENDSKQLLLGLGVSDPKRFFGTTNDLLETYGDQRVLECPTAENSYLGHAFGLTLGGFKTIVHFQRMDFMFYAFDQLINNISKWKEMFNLNSELPIVIRTVIGMGWGQGAQHSQNLSAILAQFPGLNVVVPSCPHSAQFLLEESIKQGTPTIFVEHRWLQFLEQESTSEKFKLGNAVIRKKGNSITVVTWSYSVVEALRFKELYPDLDLEIIDLLSLVPLDIDSIAASFEKTGNLIIWEPSVSFGGIGAEIIATLKERGIEGKVQRIGYPKISAPASPKQVVNYYPTLEKIALFFNSHFGSSIKVKEEDKKRWPIDKDQNQWSPWS